MDLTERLYYTDSYLREFEAEVIEVQGRRVYLNRTAFYPTSGGQPHDLGLIGQARILDVIDEGDRIAHLVDRPPHLGPVHCRIEWDRRFDHMQQHTGQHLLSAVLKRDYGITTVSFHLGRDVCTIDLDRPPPELPALELAVNREIYTHRSVSVAFEEAASASDLRKPSDRQGTLRIVTIDGLDRSACGGTHLRSTAEIGLLLLGRTEKIRNHTRLEFLCGLRALRRARRDLDSLSRIAASLTTHPADAADAVERKLAELRAQSREHRRLSIELAQLRGQELYRQTPPGPGGLKTYWREVPQLNEEVRAEAQGFLSAGRALYAAYTTAPASLLIATSPDSGFDAATLTRNITHKIGGRGGGSPTLAQCSVPDLAAALQLLRSALNMAS